MSKKISRLSLEEFYMTDYLDAASYANLRQIASLVDGLKNASRKIVYWTLQNKVKNDIKVSQYDSKVGEAMQSLHGSMADVIVGLGKSYTGTNNINWLRGDGNFGTRLIPEASAARYISASGSKELFEILNSDDTPILVHQSFEGEQIEPKFMLPNIPMLLVNGAEGISSGFAQKILPRNPIAIKKYLKYRLESPQDGTRPLKPFRGTPYYKGFKGTVVQSEGGYPNGWETIGVFSRQANKVKITELPIGYSLKSYLKVLDKLEDDKKIITYEDNTSKVFDFEVQFNRKYLDSLTDDQLTSMLKLKRKASENYTVMDQNNRVQALENVAEIMNQYIDVKLDYMGRRKSYLIKNISQDIRILVSKYVFIKSIVDNTLVITKRDIEDIEKDLVEMDKIITVDDSYDYLLNMSIRSLTKERMEKLLNQIKEAKAELDLTKSSTVEQMWLKDLN